MNHTADHGVRFGRIAAMLPVKDIVKAHDFYTKVFGFTKTRQIERDRARDLETNTAFAAQGPSAHGWDRALAARRPAARVPANLASSPGFTTVPT